MLLTVSLVNRLSVVIPDSWPQIGGFAEMNTLVAASQKIKRDFRGVEAHWLNELLKL